MLFLDAILILLASLTSTSAQAKFEWGFAGTQSVSTSLPSCRTFPITADPLTAHGVPPFYMIAFAVGEAPITSWIGTNESNLTWTVTHPIGTQLLLQVVDSQGDTGGVDVPLYTVIEGTTTACIPPAPPASNAFTVTANVTDKLSTCQPWGLTIHGGTPPYNVTLASLNSTIVTNVTPSAKILGPGPTDSMFTYIDRVVPNSQLIAAVSDFNGRWATGSPFIHTQGSADLTCRGLNSVGTNGTTSPQGDNGTTTSRRISRASVGAIVGAIVGALLLCGMTAWVWRRRQQRRQQQLPRIDIDPFEDVVVRPHPSSALFSTDTGPGASRSPSGKEAHQITMGSLLPTSERFSSTSTSPVSSPSPIVRELSPGISRIGSSSKESPHTFRSSLTPTSEMLSSTDTSPAISPPVFVHELPPPYASPRLGEQ
ncbi:hypothetical protein MVEN_01712100 [Mycena venus]|uniref:Uncharacterized protein n=1 Tax=Mycena venus TaxID=2733690 RepID=A0A8H7CNF3_9AGAR|nr:hypothetical protein MVEN_01712100 [Mycena venus]